MKNKRKGIIYFIILMLTFTLGVACSSGDVSVGDHVYPARQMPLTKQVLLITSHHEGHERTRQLISGIKKECFDAGLEVNMQLIYLDSRREGETLAYTFREARINELLRNQIELIIALDQEACNLLFTNDYFLQKKIPVICCAPTPLVAPMYLNHVTGVVGMMDYKSVYLAGKKLFPFTSHVYVISDHSAQGQLQKAIAQEQLSEFQDSVTFCWGVGERESVDDLVDILVNLPPYSLVLMTYWEYDGQGEYRSPEIYHPVFARMCPVPVLIALDNAVGLGCLGGYVTTGSEQGVIAGKKAVAILKGEELSKMPVDTLVGQPVFDARSMGRWKVPYGNLPDGSRIVNQESGIMELYGDRILWEALLVLGLIVLLMLCVIFYYRYHSFRKLSKRLEQKTERLNLSLEQKKEVLTHALTSVKEGVIVVDRQCRIIDINHFAFERLDCVWDVTGRLFNEVCELAGRRDKGESLLNRMLEKVMEEGKKYDLPAESTIVTAQGSIRNVEATVSPLFGENKEVVGAVMVARDIVQELRHENFMNMSIEILQFYTWVINIDRNIWEFGSEFSKTGAKAEQFSSYDNFLSRIHPDDRQEFKERYDVIRDQESNTHTILFRIDFAGTGNYEWWESQGMRQETILPNGDVMHYLYGISVNVHKHKETEKHLEEAMQKAEVADRQKTVFLANMAHEIRTLLNSIVGFANLLCDEHCAPEEKEGYRDTINYNNQMLLNLLNNVLDLTRIEAGLTSMHLQPCDINELMDTVIKSHKIALPEGVLLVKEGVPTHLIVESDPLKLTQVFSNLVQNAINYTRYGKITLKAQVSYDKKWIEFSVSDTGRGIEQEHVDHLFDRFYKVSEDMNGSGLGLPICRAILKMLGGSIRAESEIDRGTTVFFKIPNIGMEIDSREEKEQVSEKPLVQVRGDKKRLLIAEDTDSNFLLLKALLKKEYHLERANDGEEAIEMFKENRYDAILMDMKMPRKDGIEATIEIRKYSAIPIIAQTAYAFDSDRQRCIDAGCTDFISKPIKPEELHRILRKYL